ncbi:MAG: hypothetical protein HEQ39_09795 [Rhizobacter sp.]
MGNILTTRTRALKFHDTSLTVIRRDGEVWLRCPQIGDALGYQKRGGIAIDAVYKRHATEFTDRMTQLVKLPTAGGEQEVRVFSLRGAHLLAMFARTERAAEFRRWVLDVLEQQSPPPLANPTPRQQAVVVAEPTAPAPVPSNDVPAYVQACIDRRAFALSHELFFELRGWLMQQAQFRARGAGNRVWDDAAALDAKLAQADLAQWRAWTHAARTRNFLQLAEGAARMTAAWRDALQAEARQCAPELAGPLKDHLPPHGQLGDAAVALMLGSSLNPGQARPGA